MDPDKARTALTTERDDLRKLIGAEDVAGAQDRAAAADQPGDAADSSAPLDTQTVDDSIEAGLRDRLAAVERALGRLDDGTYGRSIESGDVIPDARLEADPAAELTVEEASAAERA